MSDKENKSFDETIDGFFKKIETFFRGNSEKKTEENQQQPGWGQKNMPWIVMILCFIVYGAFSSFDKIDSSEQGVVTRFGAFDHIAYEGAHFKLPFGIDELYKIEVTRIHELQFGFRKSGQITEQLARLESLMLTGDLNVAVVEWIVQYRIADPKKYIFNAADKEKTIGDISISAMRRVVGDKLVSDVLTTDRVKIAERAKKISQEVLDRYDIGILITKVALQNVTPPNSVKPAFNEVNMAKQETEKLINQARGTYNKIIPESEGKAERLITEAKAYAIRIVNQAKGDAKKFEQVLVAYRKAPDITRKRMYLETMHEIFSGSQKLIIVDSNLKGILPVFGKLDSIDPRVVELQKGDDADSHDEKKNDKKESSEKASMNQGK